MNKLEALKKLRDELNVEINGLENLNSDSPNVFIANHNCLKDIFYLPMSLPMETVSLISSRLIYKPDKKRQEMVEKYLYAMPIEAHGGSRYSEICLSRVQNILRRRQATLKPLCSCPQQAAYLCPALQHVFPPHHHRRAARCYWRTSATALSGKCSMPYHYLPWQPYACQHIFFL